MAKKKIEVLILSDCQYGKCGEVVELSETDKDAAAAAGLIDENQAAVKSAKG